MRPIWVAMALSVLALGVLAGCGGDDDDGGGAEATTEQTAPAPADTGGEETAPAEEGATGDGEGPTLTADENEIAWQPDELTAGAGSVTITLMNPSQIPHNVTLEQPDAASETITDGTTSVTTELEPGEYTYFCSVGNHRQLGMEGTLTVE